MSDGPQDLIGPVPDTMAVATRLCTAMRISAMPAMGSLQVVYDQENWTPCGRCLLCALLYQVPSNDPQPQPPEGESHDRPDQIPPSLAPVD